MTSEDSVVTRDCNGTRLHDGDTVHLIKNLKVKGACATPKQGTGINGIRLTDNPEEVECRTDAIKELVLKTCFLKRVSK